MSLRVILFIAASAVFAMSISATGAVPELINYQGRLTDASGTPLDTTVAMTFTIYDDPADGSIIWSESQTSVTVANGLFAVLLGSVNPIGEVVFADTVRYLGIKIGTDPEASPRTRLVSVPYAHRVITIDGATGGTISGNVNLDVSSQTTGNILKDGYPFIHNFGTYNTFVGLNSGNLIMTGTSNTGSGYYTLYNNTTGIYNSASGFGALQSNTSGARNTACGARSLWFNTTGSDNTPAVPVRSITTP